MTKEELKIKNKLIDEAILKLKKDFVGIDDQIDKVMNSVRTWYLYPDLQTRPLIVSIFGMTGTGKTALVRKIVQYLNIEENMVYFNFAEINDMKAYEIETMFDEDVSTETSNKVIVYDEFQYAATIDESGCEKDNRSGMKPFWELMDSGILHKRIGIYEMRMLYNVINLITNINSKCKIKLNENGEWINYFECIEHYKDNSSVLNDIDNYFNTNSVEKDKNKKNVEETIGTTISSYNKCCGTYETYELGSSKKSFLKDSTITRILDIKYIGSETSRIVYSEEFIKFRNFTDIDTILEEIFKIYGNKMKGYDLNLSQSIIFVIGNIDEAYTVSYDVNPDMSPDQFHKITKEISVVDIKEALQKRFRNEQIARLGNNYVIYYAFSKQNYYDIIKLYLNEYAEQVKKLTDFDMIFDKSIIDIIYKEGVFPTQGTRPIFSTIYEIVKSKLPKIVELLDENNITDVSKIKLYFKNKTVFVSVYSKDELVNEFSFKEKLQVEKLRESLKDENQALCAVHESGHFVVYAALKNKLPEKVVSKTTNKETNGFMLPSFDNKELNYTLNNVINEIQICLGGYVAEQLVFGNQYLTNGACSDLEKATILASKAIREWGFGGHPYVTSYLLNMPQNKSNLTGYTIKDDGVNSKEQDKIIALLDKAYTQTVSLLEMNIWKKMLKESAKYLSERTEIPYKKMKEIYAKVPDNAKVCHNDRYYRDCIDKI